MRFLKITTLLIMLSIIITSCITDPEEEKQKDWILADSTGTTLYNIDALSNNFAFSVGSSGNIQYYNGSNWIEENTSFSSTLSDVKIISSTNVIALNSSNLYKFDGVNWNEFEGADGGYSITVLDENHIWIGDYSGKINFYNGTEWTTIDLDYGDIEGIHAVDEENVFAFDEYGKVIHYNGIGWIELTDLDNGCFESIYAFSENDIWIAGNDYYSQKLFHFNGSEWQEIINENEYEVNDIYGLLPDNVWFACNDGIVLHWDGSNISKQSTTTNQDLNGIKMLDSKTGFAVGDSGVILNYNK